MACSRVNFTFYYYYYYYCCCCCCCCCCRRRRRHYYCYYYYCYYYRYYYYRCYWGGSEKCTVVKVPRQCPFVFLVKVGWRQSRALGGGLLGIEQQRGELGLSFVFGGHVRAQE
jgi:hypothetical protein